MCLPKEIQPMTIKPKTPPRSPWRRLKQQLKPRLSRKVVTGAKVNLNNLWSKFEDLANNKSPLMTLEIGHVRTMKVHIQDNEINENLHNERMELGN